MTLSSWLFSHKSSIIDYFLVIYFGCYCYHHCRSHPFVYVIEHSEYFGINGLACNFDLSRGSHQRCSIKKAVLRNFTNFTEKLLCKVYFSGLTPATLLKNRLRHWWFPVKFVKFLRTPFSQNTSRRLLLPIIFWNDCGV